MLQIYPKIVMDFVSTLLEKSIPMAHDFSLSVAHHACATGSTPLVIVTRGVMRHGYVHYTWRTIWWAMGV
jgi:hypothetical protein